MSDADLIALGRREIDAIGLVGAAEVIDGCVVRMPKAYPVYDDAYQDHLAVIRGWLKTLSNLELAGRNGMHKYNNQDHSMMTAVARRAEHPGPGPVRHLEGQHRRRVPRGGDRAGRRDRPHRPPADRRGLIRLRPEHAALDHSPTLPRGSEENRLGRI